MTGSPRKSLLVFSDDWGRHPSSCQHLVRRLLPRFDVLWVNTIGTRSPRLDLDTFRRGVEKIRHWTTRSKKSSPLPPNLRLANPKMWPGFNSTSARGLNRELLLRQLMPKLREFGDSTVAVTTVPIVADLVGKLPVSHWVYYCVDDFTQWPGLDQSALQRLDEKLIEQADTLIAVSQTLQERLAARGRASQLLTHGIDLPFWKGERNEPTLDELTNLESPLIVFWGLIDRRLDLSFVKKVSDTLTKGTILFVGPVADPDPALFKIKRAHRLPALDFHQLPLLAQAASVLIMPYADLPVTRAMQPLKFKEYLATGKPTVASALPATQPWSDCADLSSTPEDFVAKVCLRLNTGLPAEQRQARLRLSNESWDEKARAFERWAGLTHQRV